MSPSLLPRLRLDYTGPRARVAGISLLLLVVLSALLAGLWLRQWMWQTTEYVHWDANPRNAIKWGSYVLDGMDPANRGAAPGTWGQLWHGYWLLYDDLKANRQWSKEPLDYAPMRLLIAGAWARSLRAEHGGPVPWTHERTGFMLRLNTVMGLAAAVAAGLVAHHWSRRAGGSNRRAIVTGVAAGALLWLNAGVILEAHGWPQWDIWPIPFFLLAVYCASRRWWTAAGVLIGAGALFKAQILFAAPVLVLWPLLAGRPGDALRVVLGVAWPIAVWTLPWLVRGWVAWTVVMLAAAAAIAASVRWGRSRPAVRLACVAGFFGTILLVAFLGGGSFAWFEFGFVTGTDKYPKLARNAASNLGAILSQRYGWEHGDIVFGTLRIDRLMVALYGVGLLCCAVAATFHARRNSPRLLAAVVAPWVVFFAVMPQMDGRYLMYGAATSSILVGLGLGPVLLHFLMTAMNCFMMLKFMLVRFPDYWPAWTEFLNGTEPDMGWAVLTCAGVMLYIALTPGRREGAGKPE